MINAVDTRTPFMVVLPSFQLKALLTQQQVDTSKPCNLAWTLFPLPIQHAGTIVAIGLALSADDFHTRLTVLKPEGFDDTYYLMSVRLNEYLEIISTLDYNTVIAVV